MKLLIITLVCFAALVGATDFRSEFDRLLVQTTIEYTTKLNYRMLEIQSEINHFGEHPTQAEKDKIIVEMESIITYAQQSELVFTDKLKTTDLNMAEKYEYESALKASQNLIKVVKETEVKVKAVKIGTNPSTPTQTHPLHITVKDFQTMEARLMQIQEEINQLEVSKSKAEQSKIVKEIEETIAYVNLNLPKIQAELKRTDLHLQDQVTLELGEKIGEILVKDLKEAEVKVKAVKVQ